MPCEFQCRACLIKFTIRVQGCVLSCANSWCCVCEDEEFSADTSDRLVSESAVRIICVFHNWVYSVFLAKKKFLGPPWVGGLTCHVNFNARPV